MVDLSDDQPLTPPIRRPHPGTRHFIDLSDDIPPAPPSKSPEPRYMPDKSRSPIDYGQYSRSSPERGAPPIQQGPVRGKPLIFAAMAATSEVDDLEPEMVEVIENAPVETKITEGYNSYAYNQRQQTSTPPPEPAPVPQRDPSPTKRQSSKLQKHSSSRKPVPPVNNQREQQRSAAPAPSQPVERNGSSRHHSHRESMAADARIHQHETVHRQGSSASVEAPRDAPRESRRKGSSHDGAKLQKRSRDGVKVLTGKQKEKLNNRMSYSGVSASKDHVAQQARKSFVEEHPSTRPSMPQHTSHRSSQAFAAPAPSAVSHRPPLSPDKQLPQRGRPQPPQMPQAQWPEHHAKRPSMQLPTPPEEYTPSPESRRETSPHRVKHIPPKNVEEMEVFAGKSQPHTPAESRASTRPQSQMSTSTDSSSYPLLAHLSDPVLLESLLAYLSYFEWLKLSTASKEVRQVLYEDGREQVLSRYLQTVGYSKWTWNDPEPLILTIEVRQHCYNFFP